MRENKITKNKVVERNFGDQPTRPAHRTELLKADNLEHPTMLGNEHAQATSSRINAYYNEEQGNDSIKLSWPGLKTSSQQHETVPESGDSKGWPTDSYLIRSSDNSKYDHSSKVIESIKRRNSAFKRRNIEDTNRNNGTNDTAMVVPNDGGTEEDSREAGESLDAKWTGESAESKRRDIYGIRNSTTESGSIEAEATTAKQLISSLIVLAKDSPTSSGDTVKMRNKLKRPNNGTMSTNATLIGEERSSDQKKKSFDNNNITQASATTLTILSENGEVKHGLITTKSLSKDNLDSHMI